MLTAIQPSCPVLVHCKEPDSSLLFLSFALLLLWARGSSSMGVGWKTAASLSFTIQLARFTWHCYLGNIRLP